MLESAVSGQLGRAYQMANVETAVRECQDTGSRVAALLNSERVIAADVLDILSHSRDTFSHLINVCSYSVLLAKRLGISDQRELSEIAIGGMLHDVGKRRIPREILHSPTPLTSWQKELIRDHPRQGFVELHGHREGFRRAR